MADTNRATAEQIARDLMVAWLPHSGITITPDKPAATGEEIGEIYRALLAKVISGPK